MTFMLRGGSRNAFDAERNSSTLPRNFNQICGQKWDPAREGERVTVTCSENAKLQASRVSPDLVAGLPMRMTKRLMQMRMLDDGRLLGRWWLILIDGTLQDRGRKTKDGQARYRYVLEAKLLGPCGFIIPLISEFQDCPDLVRDKADCELNALCRLAAKLYAQFPQLPICLSGDGLYPCKRFFDLCEQYKWKFIATLREGRQPTAWDDAVQTMMLSPEKVQRCTYQGENGPVEQTLRWTDKVAFREHDYQVIFAGQIAPSIASLWAWVTNFELDSENVLEIANRGGRARQAVENSFNVQKNGGFGLEHAFCANENASQNYHIMMQVAHILQQLCINGLLRRLTRGCRKLSDRKLIDLLFDSLRWVEIGEEAPLSIQIRFSSA